ncbi:hypothetical protein [Kitasatospora sp. NPDC047058]|uniref:hypothetical protein n=1 Tax=Kitasatospora sp. NPDC047058 TaxID=3155620 RepID=UPI0033C6E15E
MDISARRTARVRRVLGAAALALATGAATLSLAAPATAAPLPIVTAPVQTPAGVTADAGERFVPVPPARVMDTRTYLGLPSPLYNSMEQTLQVAGRGGVPATGVKAVVLNVTVTETHTPGFLTVWPSGAPKPDSSNLNWAAGQTVSNQVVVPVGADGRVKLVSPGSGGLMSGGTPRVEAIADVFGYYTDDQAAGSTFSALSPGRLLDTRAAVGTDGTAPVPGSGQVDLQVAGRGGVPQSGVKAVVLNVTVTEPQSNGFVKVWPSGIAQPDVSSINWTPGQTKSNHVVVPVGADGKVSFYNAAGGSTHFVADVFGYYSDDPAGTTFHPVGPGRLVDTRTNGGPLGAFEAGTLDLSGHPALPGAKTVVLNVTVTEPQAPGFLTAWPYGTELPDSSNLNWTAGQTVPNLVTVPLSADGKVNLGNVSGGSSHLVLDVFGYFS